MIFRRQRSAERGVARCRAAAEKERRRSGTTGRGSLSKSPDCPLLLDVRWLAEVNPSDRCQARASGSHWLASGAASENLFLATTSRRTEQGKLLRHVRRPRQHARTLRDGAERCRRRAQAAASADQRHGDEGRGQHGSSIDQEDSMAGCCERSGRPTMCSTLAPAESPSSHQPLARVAATRCGSAPKPRRSSDEAPPWQRGPAGRRSGAERKERREDDMEQGFRGTARRQHLVAGLRA